MYSHIYLYIYLGLKINKLTSNSKTILMYAAKYNDKLVIEYILTEWKHEKVDLNIESKSRNTAIHYAVKHVYMIHNIYI